VTVYLDTSVIVKRYIAEAASDEVRALLRTERIVGSAAVAIAETSAAFRRAVQEERLAPGSGNSAQAAFNEDRYQYIWFVVDASLSESAGALAWRHSLRGFDAVHLAAALRWSEAMRGEPMTFATFDRTLRAAALRSWLHTWPEL
jgi:predicted nucleic acid-binding protein